MVKIKTLAQIDGIRSSSHLAAEVLKYTLSFVAPGVNTQTLNNIAHKYIVDHDAIPAPLNYEGYPRSICTSVNDIVCHGIPSTKIVLKKGDIVNVDVTTILNGYYGDVSATVGVGQISSEAQLLIDRTKTALNMAIKNLKPGRMLNDAVGDTIEKYVSQFGYSPVRELGGHGVGLKFHEDPFVFHYHNRLGDVKLAPGMIFTIEPMINASKSWKVNFDRQDGWTVRTNDDALSCQFEHTVLITPTGSEILTL